MADAAVAAAVATLRSLQPCDLKQYPELQAEGLRLFERAVKVKCFGEENPDVVAFLRQKEDYRALLKRLERVGAVVEEAHAAAVQSSGSAAINQMRDVRTSEVHTRGVAALSTQEGLMTLLEGLSVDTTPLRGRLCSTSECDVRDSSRLQSTDHAPPPSAIVTGADHYAAGNDFRAGGIGRSRGRKAAFSMDRVRGLYDDPTLLGEAADDDSDGDGAANGSADAVASSENAGRRATAVRRKGVIYFVPRARATSDMATQALPRRAAPAATPAPAPSDHGTTARNREGDSVDAAGAIPGLGMLCYVRDDDDGVLRACALRTLVRHFTFSSCPWSEW